MGDRKTIEEIVSMLPVELGDALLLLISLNFHHASDGCTGVKDVVIENESGKDAVCMIHDWQYYTATVPKWKADLNLLVGYIFTGHRWVGLRRYMYFFLGGGKKAWLNHRRFGHSLDMWKRHISMLGVATSRRALSREVSNGR